MKTTITIDDELFTRASEMIGVSEENELVRRAIETLIRVEAGRDLAAMCGSDSDASCGSRICHQP